MKTIIFSALVCLFLVSMTFAQPIVSLEVTGSWTAEDYDVSSTGPDGGLGIPEEDDDLVFGTPPSDGSTTFTLLVDVAGAIFIPEGSMGVTHDWYGYTNVSLDGTHMFGSASWVTSDIITGLVGPGGATAALWTNTDISLANPTRLSFRMFGSWEGSTADLFVGARSATTIGTEFLLWEYYGGEEIRSQTYSGTSVSSPPVCDAGGPYSGDAGVPITFDGSGSYANGGEIVEYFWDFGDGGVGSGMVITHTYSADGNYLVILCVSDDQGQTSCCSPEGNYTVPSEQMSWGRIKATYR